MSSFFPYSLAFIEGGDLIDRTAERLFKLGGTLNKVERKKNKIHCINL